MEVEMVLEEHLRKNVGRYFPELCEADVSLESEGQRPSRLSTTHFFRIRVGATTRRLVVKLPPDRLAAAPRERARVAPVMQRADKFASEARTLELLASHFESKDDPRFGAVRLLDFIGECDAVVMERCPDPSLRELLLPSRRLLFRDLSRAFEHVGCWLRRYQELESLPHTRTRHEERDAFSATVAALAGFTGESWLAGLADHVAAVAQRELPETLALGTAHGDLAPRNILVSPSDRVTVLDTRAAWRAPVLEDVGYLLASIWTSRARALGFGVAQSRRTLMRYEASFLSGYFGDRPVSTSAVRLFEIQALLDRYAALHAERQALPGPSRAGAAAHWASERCLRQRICSVVQVLPSGGLR